MLSGNLRHKFRVPTRGTLKTKKFSLSMGSRKSFLGKIANLNGQKNTFLVPESIVLLPAYKYMEFHSKQNPKGNFGFSLRLTGQQRRWKYYWGNDGNTYERAESTLKNTGKQGRGANKEESGEWLRLNFARKCLKNDIMKKHFPKNEKIHQMETRNEELLANP